MGRDVPAGDDAGVMRVTSGGGTAGCVRWAGAVMLKSTGRNYAKSFSLEMYACEFCELCVQVCPTDAIVMTKSFDMATTDRRELLLDKDRLQGAPSYSGSEAPDWSDPSFGRRIDDYYGPFPGI